MSSLPVAPVALSMTSAACYGVATALQHHAAVRQPRELSMRPGLLVGLLREPRWQFGNVLDATGFVLQFLALRSGAVALVEALLVTGLVIAIWVAALLDHRRVSFHEVFMAIIVTAGVALFLSVARPTFRGVLPPLGSSVTLAVAVGATVILAALAARSGTARQAAVALAVGAAVAFAYTAVLTSITGHLLDGGTLRVLSSWPLYALVVTGVVAILLTQSAFNAGPLRFSLPTLTVVQPIVAAVMGWAFLGQRINVTGIAPLWELCALACMTAGVFSLVTRSPDLTSPADGSGQASR